MYSDKKSVLQLVAVLRAQGVRRVVLCPGSRNVPLVQSFSACRDFECFSVTDERSAGFFAIGLALHRHEPVAVCCTSGSALLNLHPAVCEAFYRQLPLIVVSADRPAAWIGQMDGQTLPQPGVFGTMVRSSVTLPEVHTEEDEWYANRLVNEAVLEAAHHGCGPVHINVPLSEPLFHFSVKQLPEVRFMRRLDMSDGGTALTGFLKDQLPRYSRVMVVTGQMPAGEAAAVAACLPAGKTVWLTEVLGNMPGSSPAIRGFDALLGAVGEEERQALSPDLVVTMGGHIVSKRLKHFLRAVPSLVHWHVAPDGRPADLFGALTTVAEASPLQFARLFSQAGGCLSETYPERWQACAARVPDMQAPYSALYAVRRVMESLPPRCVLHLANSSAVRLAGLFPLPEGAEVHGNRGVNGIEGSVSAAVGYAAVSDRLNFLLTGDLSFFYDMNALWNAHVPARLRIVLLNNGGGAIFHTLPGLDTRGRTGRFVTAVHDTSARGWAESLGWTYRMAADEDALSEALDELTDAGASAPVLLEVRTDAATDAAVWRDFYNRMKEDFRRPDTEDR